jgi:mannose-6-phosphate isomerase-like protein (cupin superfamily)
LHFFIDNPQFLCYTIHLENQKKYSPRGKLTKKCKLATFDAATPWKDANIAFNWINFEYPLIHKHTDWEILLVLQGQILHTINESSKLLTPGIGCLIGPNDNHAIFYPNKKKNDFQGISIIIRDSYLRTFLQLYGGEF